MENLIQQLNKFIYYQEVIEGKSEHTIKSYHKDIMQFIEYIFIVEEISDFNEIEMITFRSFIVYLTSAYIEKGTKEKNMKVGKRSINRKMSALRSFFGFLQEQKIVIKNNIQYINMPKFEMDLPTLLSKNDMDRLRQTIQTEKTTGKRDRLVIELLYSSGLRASELINLTEYMIDFDERELRILGKGNKERITFFSEESKKWLLSYIKAKQKEYTNYTKNYIFANSKGEKLTTRSLRRLVSDYGKKAGIQKSVTPHVFRHTFATTLLNKGVDIRYLQELLGHSSIATTQIYTHVSKVLLKEAYMKAHPWAIESENYMK